MKTKKRVYNNGLPFNNIVATNLTGQLQRVKKKKASLVIVDGGVGEGKTTFMVECADYLNGLKGLPPISLEKKDYPQLAMGGEQFLDKLRQCHERKLPVVIYDEAGDFDRRGALSKFNKMINRAFDTYRGFQVIVLMGLPSFNVLDQSIFDKKIPRILFNLYNRGKSYGEIRAYSLYRMEYLRFRMKKLAVKSFAYKIVRPNFKARFKDLSKERSRQLDYLSTTSKLSILTENALKLTGMVSYNDIASELNMSMMWVSTKIRGLGIKSKKTIKRVKYFDKSVLDRLGDFI